MLFKMEMKLILIVVDHVHLRDNVLIICDAAKIRTVSTTFVPPELVVCKLTSSLTYLMDREAPLA